MSLPTKCTNFKPVLILTNVIIMYSVNWHSATEQSWSYHCLWGTTVQIIYLVHQFSLVLLHHQSILLVAFDRLEIDAIQTSELASSSWNVAPFVDTAGTDTISVCVGGVDSVGSSSSSTIKRHLPCTSYMLISLTNENGLIRTAWFKYYQFPHY